LPDDDRMSGRQPWTTGDRAEPRRIGRGGAGYGFRTGGRRGAAVPAALLDDRSQRRYQEFLVPTAVILAGVLVVVAFAFIVSAAMRSDDGSDAIPPAQPPALGQVPLAPTDQGAIPIPETSASVSATPSPSPTLSPSPSATTTRPPATRKPTAPPAVKGLLTIDRGEAPSRVDLAEEGTRDWVHWGEQNAFSLERKEDGNFAILEGTPSAPRFRHGLSPQRFSWSDGSPVENSNGTPTGIRTCDEGNGFTISAPAGTGTRVLRLYLGVDEARGKLDARLSTGETARATLESRGPELDTAVFTITYRATTSATINLRWYTDRSFDDDCGGVALQAATLR
jgi:hypothetical protein